MFALEHSHGEQRIVGVRTTTPGSGRARRSPACHLVAGLVWLAAWGGCAREVPTTAPPTRLFDPLSYRSPPGPREAFGSRDARARTYLHRQGSLAVQVLTRSGSSPRMLVTFPTGERAIGVWFLAAPEDTELYAGAAADEALLAAGGGLVAVRREQGQYPLDGVRGTLKTNATRLSTEQVLLGSSSAPSDYEAGVCLEDAARFPELHRARFELDRQRNALRVRRDPSGGEPALELLLVGVEGTRIELLERSEPSRPSCPLAPGTSQPLIAMTNDAGITVEFVALTSTAPPGGDDAPVDAELPETEQGAPLPAPAP